MFKKKQDIRKILSSGNRDFLEKLYLNYGKKLVAYGRTSWTLNEDTAWDLLYKTLYKVVEVYERYTFESEEKFASFVFRIYINQIKNYLREQKTKGIPTNFLADEHEDFAQDEQKAPESRQVQVLHQLLDELEDWQRILLLMRSDGKSYSEIAAFVDKPENQLKVYYQRLKEQLSKNMYEQH